MKLLVAATAVGLQAAPAEAANFLFSYAAESGGVLAGKVIGELQPDDGSPFIDGDDDAIFIERLFDVTYNGVPGPELPFVESFVEFSGAVTGERSPSIAISGHFMDLIACTMRACDTGEGFAFSFYAPVGGGAAFSSPAFGGFDEPFEVSRYEVVRLEPIPLPAPLALLGGGAAALAALGAFSSGRSRCSRACGR